MLDRILHLESIIEEASVFSHSKATQHEEVFTSFGLITEGIEHCINDDYTNVLISKDETFFDASAGRGNFPIIAVKYLFNRLHKEIPDERARLKYIIEKQTFMAEIQPESANFIAYHFQFGMDLKVNLYRGDTLQMPEDFFDRSYDMRREMYPEHCVLCPVEPAVVEEIQPEILVNTPSLPRSERVSKAKPSKTSAKPKKSPKIKGEKLDMTMTFIDV